MIDLVKVIMIKPVEGHALDVVFSDRMTGTADLSDLLAEGGPMIEGLRERSMFDRVYLSLGVPSWPNGFQLDAIGLHMDMMERGLLQTRSAA